MLALSYRTRDRLATWGSSAALVPVCAYFALVDYGTPGVAGLPWLLVHSANLIVHEAGHFVFRWFGEWVMYLGGSLLQVLLPAVFVGFFVLNHQKLGLQLSLAWLGQNFVDVSVYAADAQARAMPLLGGLGAESHDWWNILILRGWLHLAPEVAAGIYACAFVAWGAMLVVPRWVS